jgi:hypothetical protein
LLLDLLDRRQPGLMPFAASIALMTASAVILYSHSALLSQIAMIAGSCAFGIALIAWRRGCESGVAAFVAVLLPATSVIAFGYTFSKVPLESFALAGLSPLALVPLLVLKGRMGTVIGSLPFLAVCGYAMVKTMQVESLPTF